MRLSDKVPDQKLLSCVDLEVYVDVCLLHNVVQLYYNYSPILIY